MIKFIVVSENDAGCIADYFETRDDAISWAKRNCDLDDSYNIYCCELLGKVYAPEPIFVREK